MRNWWFFGIFCGFSLFFWWLVFLLWDSGLEDVGLHEVCSEALSILILGEDGNSKGEFYI